MYPIQNGGSEAHIMQSIERVTLRTPGDLLRTAVLLLVFSLLPPLRMAQAQERTLPPVPSSIAAALAAPVDTADLFDEPEAAEARRDRGRGALYGAGIGALVGGVGFAGLSYAFTKSKPRDAGVRIMFVLGAAAGSAAGAIVGAIIGVPERDEARAQQVQLHLVPVLSHGGTLAISVSLPSR